MGALGRYVLRFLDALDLPRAVLGGVGVTSPNSKLNLAGIGIGGQGAADLDEMRSEDW